MGFSIAWVNARKVYSEDYAAACVLSFTLLALGSLYGSEWVNLASFQLPAGKGTALSPALCVCDSGGGQQRLQKFTLETYKFAFSYDIIEQ